MTGNRRVDRNSGSFGGVRPWALRASWRAALVAPVLFLASCISEQREQEIGDQLAADVNLHLPLIEERLLTQYVQAIGDGLVRVSERPHLDYSFYLVDTDVVNAFALPGGHVYLTRGLIDRTADGPEFAGVLAHEIAHVAAGHGVSRIQRQMRTSSLVDMLYDVLLGGEPEILRSNSLEFATAALSARHSRKDEHEADRLAVRYLLSSGIDPSGVVTLLETLHDDEQSEEFYRMSDWLSSHPLTSRRIEDARSDIASYEDEVEAVQSVSVDGFPAFKLLVTRGQSPAVISE